MTHSTRQHGYVALISVLIVGAACTAIGLTLLLTSSGAQQEALAQQQSIQARKLADACGEEALQRIYESTSYTGNSNLTFTTGTCNYSVTNTGGLNRTINAMSSVNGVVRKIQIYVTINSTSISITSWQDIS